MARTSTITIEQVAQIAQELQAQGVTPGVRAVRERLGTGSNQTIQTLLTQWRAAQPAVAAAPVAAAVALSEGFMQAIGQEMQRVQAQTIAAYEGAVAEAVAARDTTASDALATYAENERLSSTLEERTSALNELQGRFAAQSEQLQALANADNLRVKAEKELATVQARFESEYEKSSLAMGERDKAEKATAAAVEARTVLEAQAREQAKALTTAQAQVQALEAKVAELQKLDALRIAAEQRASKAETQVAMLQPRAELVDGLQQQVATLSATAKHLEASETAHKAQIEKLQGQVQAAQQKAAEAPEKGQRSGSKG